MLMFLLAALAVILSSADALDKTRIMDQPPPMKGFVVNPVRIKGSLDVVHYCHILKELNSQFVVCCKQIDPVFTYYQKMRAG